MSSTSAMSIDTKNLLSIQQLVPKTVDANTESDLENALLLQLARNVTATEIDASSSELLDMELNSAPFAPTHLLINNTSLETPNFVFTSTFTDVSSGLLDSSSVFIDLSHNGVSKKIEVLANSSSYFDSHIKSTVTDNMVFYDELESSEATKNWTATFAYEDNYNFLKAINSDLNTDGELPMKIKEDVKFNQNYALGQDMYKYYTLDASSGKPVVNPIADLSNVALENQFTIIDTDLTVYQDKYMGTYKIVQTEDNPIITIDPSDTAKQSPFYNHKGVHGSVTASDPSGVPIGLTYDEFIELFDASENMKILPEYKATFTVEASNGGYTFADDDNYEYISINDSQLVDNHRYMQDVVQHRHYLTWRARSGILDFSANTTGTFTDNNLQTVNTDASNLQYFSRTSYGEKLGRDANIVNRDGQIILNKQTDSTRIIEEDLSANLAGVHVYNIGEASIDASGDTLNDADSTSRFVKYDVQNVLKLSGDGINSYGLDGSILDSNGASMFFLERGGYVPPIADVSFTSLVAPVDGEAEFIKITSNLLLASEDPIVDDSNTIVPNLGGYVFANNINLPELNFSKYHIKATQKTVSDLSLLTGNNAGWSFIMENTHANDNVTDADTYLKSDSGTVNNTNMPVHAQQIVMLDSSCSFGMVYGAAPESITIVHDYVNIFYDVSGVTQVITIPNNQIHKIFDPSSYSKVIDTSFVETGSYNGSVIGIKKQTLTNVFNAKFMFPMQPYNNIVVVTPKVKSVITSYKAFNITDSSNAIPLPDSVIPKFYFAKHGALHNGQYNATITLESVDENTALGCNGVIEAKDLKPWKLNLMAFDAVNNVDVAVSEHPDVDGDVYYETASFLELNDELEVDPNPHADVVVVFALLEIPDIETTGDLFLNSPSYKLNLTNSSGNNRFIVNNLTLDASGFSTTPIANAGHLTATFDDIHNLINGNAYLAKITYEDVPVPGGAEDDIISTVVLTISKNDVTHYVIKISQKIVSDMIIYKNTMDWYRIIKMIGEGPTDASHNETIEFVQTNYPFVYNNTVTPAVTAFKVDNGIYIEGSNSNVSYGDRAVFRLKNVEMSVSPLGAASSTLNELYDQVDFVVTDTNPNPESNIGNITETLTINRYRNFYGLTGVEHKYTFVRIATQLQIFVVDGSNQVTTQQFNTIRYANERTVDALSNALSSYGDIGLKFTPNYSIFPGDTPRIMEIDVTGDPVKVRIENPLQVESDNYPFSLDTTLKAWDIYKYSGNVFDMATKRVKLNNSDFTDASFSYELYLEPRKVLVTHSQEYIGNPLTHVDYQLMSVRFPDDSYADEFTYYEAISDVSGVVIPGYILKRSSTLATRLSTSFVVVAPPFLSFEHMRDLLGDNHITALPYMYNNHAMDVIKLYLPVVDSNEYNPFSVDNIFNSSVIGQNDVTFQREPKEFYEYDTNARALYEIIVLGNSIKIEEYYGLKTIVGTPQLLTTLYNGRINDLIDASGAPFRFVSNVAQNYIVKYQQNLSPFINISVANTLGNNGEAFNISFAIGNAFLNNGVYDLDLESGQGTNVEFLSCSTVLDASSGELALFFEKYSTDAPFDYSNLPLDQLRRISFVITKRESKTVKLPSIVFGPEPYNLEKTRRLVAADDVSGPWTNVPIDESFAFNFNLVAMSEKGVEKMIEIFAISPTSPFKANYVTMKDLITMTSSDGSAVYRVKFNGGVISMFDSLGAEYINPLPVYHSQQDSSDEYVTYNVNHFVSLI